MGITKPVVPNFSGLVKTDNWRTWDTKGFSQPTQTRVHRTSTQRHDVHRSNHFILLNSYFLIPFEVSLKEYFYIWVQNPVKLVLFDTFLKVTYSIPNLFINHLHIPEKSLIKSSQNKKRHEICFILVLPFLLTTPHQIRFCWVSKSLL